MGRQSPRDGRGSELGRLLRQARERLGFTQLQVAALVGVGNESISRAEAGQAPRHSTLMRYLESFPGLSAHSLLLREPSSAPVAWDSAWDAFSSCFGLCASSVSYVVAEVEGQVTTNVDVLGLHPTEADGHDESIRAALMGAAFLGERRLARTLWPEDSVLLTGRQSFEDATGSHEFLFRTDGSLDYHARLWGSPLSAKAVEAEDDSPDTLSVQCEHDLPASELTLRLPCPPGFMDLPTEERPRPRLRIWPKPTPSSEPDIAAELHPRGLDFEFDEQGGCGIVLHKPMPGLRHELSWVAADTEAESLARVLAGPWSLGSAVKSIRADEGLTTRELATRMDVSPGTISHAEAGRDARFTTLCSLADAVEDLHPQALLPARPAALELTPAELWTYCRQVMGFEARELEKILFIDEEGYARNEITTRGLKSLRNDGRDLLIRHGMHRSIMNDTRDVMLSELQADRDVGLRVLKSRDALARHELRFPKRVAQTGFDYKRILEKRGRYFLTGDALGKASGGPPPYKEGMSLPVQYPAQRLSLKVVFPPGYAPTRVEALALPSFVPPSAGLDRLSTFAPCPPALLRRRGDVTTLSLKVERPMVGIHYTMVWGIPDSYDPRT